ncbi:HNH endonuclease, partial [Candidatus Roizmanbacteria bacterium]|nr:HNH endonuclease [Candidatus Roizmanbacteria bacterium]
MGFSKSIKEEALISSRRCCCICHEFVGLYTNVHHIVPIEQNGEDILENAIVLCLTCHGEVGHYNNKHPIGNKYSFSELKEHKQKWFEWCNNNPYAPLPKSPIVISPHEIPLGSKEWCPLSQIDLYNKTDTFLYQLWIKILVNSRQLDQENVNISLGNSPMDSKMEFGNKYLLDQQLLQINAVDSKNNKCIFLVIDKINPKTSYSFGITINSAKLTDYRDSLY